MLPESFIQELKFRNDIEDVVSSYVNLKRGGKTLAGLCPFHSEKSPSFHVYPNTQSFYCFGCGAGGDVITFVRRMENLEYMEALRFLAQRSGLDMPDEVESDGSARLKTRILEINREAARIFHQNLSSPAGREGLNYLRSRGLSDQTIRRFGLGYSLSGSGLYKLLSAKGYTDDELIAAAVAAKSNRGTGCFDIFQGRVMFPILDLRGNVIAFGGRLTAAAGQQGWDKRKYLNTSDTPVFKKSRNLFALNFAKNSGEKGKGLILAEGYMDVISLHQAGFDNAVATLGTALTPEQSRQIAHYTKLVRLCYDSDGPGQAATARAIDLLSKAGVQVKVIQIPNAKDPDEYIKKFGPQRFKLLLEGSVNSIEYTISAIRQKYDLESDDGKMNCLNELAAMLTAIPNEISRDVYISRIAADFDTSKEALASQVNYLRKRKRRESEKKAMLDPFAVNPSGGGQKSINTMQRQNNIKYARAEDGILAALVLNPDYFKWVSRKIRPEDFVTDCGRSIAQAVYGRLEQNLSADISFLGESLDPEAISLLVRLQNDFSEQSIPREDVETYISTLLQRRTEKSQKELSEMSMEEYAQYLANITKGKAGKPLP